MSDPSDGASGKPTEPAPKAPSSTAPTDRDPTVPFAEERSKSDAPTEPDPHGPDFAAIDEAVDTRVSEVPAPKTQGAPVAYVGTTLKSDTSAVADVIAMADSVAAGRATEGSTATDGEEPHESSPPSASPSSAPESQPSVLQVLAPHLSEEQEAARRKDKMRGLIIIGVTFVLCILLSVWGKEAAEPMDSEPPRPPTTVGVMGWPKAVNVEQTLAVARHTTPRDQLRGFVAEQVKSDGTIDFTDKRAQVRYSFQSGPGEGPQPVREPGTVPRRSYCGRQNVFIRRHGLVADPDVPSFPCGSKLKDPLPDPHCSLKQIWDFMIHKRGAPQGKPARIEYYSSKVGPAFRFTLPGSQHRLSLADDCSTVLSNTDSLGGVP